jgi:hypothetical protein
MAQCTSSFTTTDIQGAEPHNVDLLVFFAQLYEPQGSQGGLHVQASLGRIPTPFDVSFDSFDHLIGGIVDEITLTKCKRLTLLKDDDQEVDSVHEADRGCGNSVYSEEDIQVFIVATKTG